MLEVNYWLCEWCDAEGFGFVEPWATFQWERGLYEWDCLHLKSKGANLLILRLAETARKALN